MTEPRGNAITQAAEATAMVHQSPSRIQMKYGPIHPASMFSDVQARIDQFQLYLKSLAHPVNPKSTTTLRPTRIAPRIFAIFWFRPLAS